MTLFIIVSGIRKISGETKRRLTSHESTKSQFVWSPDGSRIAFVGANRLFEVDVASGRTTELAWNIAGGYNVYDYSPDGKWLVYGRSDEDQNQDVYLFDIGANREVNISRNPFLTCLVIGERLAEWLKGGA